MMWLSSLALFFCIFSLRPAVSGPLQPRLLPRPTSKCSVTVTTTTRIIGVASVPVTVTAQCGGTATAARAPAAGRTGRGPLRGVTRTPFFSFL
jgi:hypothetical protein